MPTEIPVTQIFLSYSRPDQEAVESIGRKLDEEGFKVWLDVARLKPGDLWSDELDRAISESTHVLVFVGRDASRPWQREEVRTALNGAVTGSCRVIPVLLPGVAEQPRESELPRFLANRHWVAFRESLDDARAWHLLRAGIRGEAPGFQPTSSGSGRCPYKGLAVFDVADRGDFFGRKAAEERILNKLRGRIKEPLRPRFFAIIAASGTGKSSLARAGLLGAVATGEMDDCGQWLGPALIFKPGAAPLNELAKELCRHPLTAQRFQGMSISQVVETLRTQEAGEYRALADELDAALPRDGYLAILIDQFEEALKPLGGSAPDEEARRKEVAEYQATQLTPLVRNLHFAVSEPQGRLVVLATMRDDFYGRCGAAPLLAALIGENHELLAPLSREELRDVIEMPAGQGGKRMERALRNQLVDAMENRPGALPLLQTALEQLWANCGDTLTLERFQEQDGIAGALTRKLEPVYRRLTGQERGGHGRPAGKEKLIRRIFLDLVQRTNGVYSSRRRSRDELPAGADADAILHAFAAADARVLLESKGDDGQPRYELTHEALIEHWKPLREWLATDEADDRFRETLERDAEQWHRERLGHKEKAKEWRLLEPEYLRQRKLWSKTEAWLKHSWQQIPLAPRTAQFVERCREYARGRRNRLVAVSVAAVALGGLLLAGTVVLARYLGSAHLAWEVAAIDGQAVPDPPISLSRDAHSTDHDGLWWRPWFLSPRTPYWLKVHAPGYLEWSDEIVVPAAGEHMMVKATLAPDDPNWRMVTIPSGCFTMGSEKSPDERPPHPVCIKKPFRIGRTEVTFAEYDEYVREKGLEPPDDGGWGRGSRPVINVSWNDAVAYARWLSEKEGKRYRLPTEAEWEYAARAGSVGRYWWGDNIQEKGKFWANCNACDSRWSGKTAPTGSFSANDFGLKDTAGNVWEWVEDCWHDNYQSAPKDGSAWKVKYFGSCGQRVLRGSSWSYSPGGLRSADRWRDSSFASSVDIGFRLAQDL